MSKGKTELSHGKMNREDCQSGIKPLVRHATATLLVMMDLAIRLRPKKAGLIFDLIIVRDRI